jgi:protein-tyrosine phosphatase
MQRSGFNAASKRALKSQMTKKVLFLCTGNYYRSRFAEMLFNALASEKHLGWNADSRGLALGSSNVGPVYPRVLDQLKALGFPTKAAPRSPVRLEMADLESADLIIALNESEHRHLLSLRFEQWVDQVLYWDIPDLDLMKAEDAFSQIEMRTTGLVQRLLEESEPFET